MSAAIAFGTASVHAQTARTDAVLEIVGSAGTAAIEDVLERVALGKSAWPQLAFFGASTEMAHPGFGEADFVASINTIADGGVGMVLGSQTNCATGLRETCSNLILAQYN